MLKDQPLPIWKYATQLTSISMSTTSTRINRDGKDRDIVIRIDSEIKREFIIVHGSRHRYQNQ